MPRHIDRLRRLERHAEVATFDPREVCNIALDCYTSGLDLPANLDDRSHRLALVYIDALITTDPNRW